MSLESLSNYLVNHQLPTVPSVVQIQVSDVTVKSHSPVKVVLECQTDLTTISLPALPVSALLACLPTGTGASVPTTITIDNGGAGPEDASLTLECTPGNFALPINDASRLAIDKTSLTFSAKPKADPPVASFEAKGTIPLDFFDKPQPPASSTTATVTMTVQESGTTDSVYATLGINFPQGGLKMPDGFPDVITLDNFSGLIGVSFDPPGCLIGFSATASIGDGGIPQTKATIVLDMEAEIPNPLYLAGQVDGKVSQADLMAAWLPGSSLVIPEHLSGMFTLIDPAFTWCEKKTPLPNGRQALPGFSFQGFVSVFGEYQFYGHYTMDYKKSVAGKFQGSPIDFAKGVLTISGNGQEIALKKGIKPSHIPQSEQKWNKRKTESPTVMVKKGGPELNFDFTKETVPTAKLSGTVSFLGVPQSINAEIGNNGIQFEYSEMVTLARATSAFTINGEPKASGSIAFSPLLDIPLPDHLGSLSASNASITTSFVVTASKANATINVDFLGETIQCGLEMEFTGVTDLKDFITAAAKHIEDHPHQIVVYLCKNPKFWFNAMETGLVKAAQLPLKIVDGAPAVMETLAHKQVFEALNAIGVKPKDIGVYLPELKTTWPVLQYASEKIWAAAFAEAFPHALSDAGFLLQDLGLSAADIALGFAQAAINPKYAAVFLNSELGKTPADIIKMLKVAGYAKSEVESAFQSLGGDFAKVGEAVWHKITHSPPLSWL